VKNILAIIGSLRARSANLLVVQHVAAASTERLNIEIYDGLRNLPQFNPDLDTESPPDEVIELRNLIQNADGILICTPEYVFGVPGALKNAIDWTVSSADFRNKPTALITASLSGEKAHESLFLTLKTVEAKIGENLAVLIPHIRTKLNGDGTIKDAETIKTLDLLIDSLIKTIEE
jgi:NAD(P)H-dependent FMN reductase